MKILLIDNGSSYLKKLQELLEGNQVEVVKLGEGKRLINNFDVVILSGGHEMPVVGNQDYYKDELGLIKNSSKPIIGICLGFELIAFAFGGKLKRLNSREQGVMDIYVTEQDDIFKGIESFQVYESHRWVVEELSEVLRGLAKSRDGWEIIKHKSMPIYGLQFHPEMLVDASFGRILFNNLIDGFKRF